MNQIIFSNSNRRRYYWYEECRGFVEIQIHHYASFHPPVYSEFNGDYHYVHLSRHDSQKRIGDEYRKLDLKGFDIFYFCVCD
jgi:hypothetical protein